LSSITIAFVSKERKKAKKESKERKKAKKPEQGPAPEIQSFRIVPGREN
jgi:hypothetical protein